MLTMIVMDNSSGNKKLVMDSSNTGMKPKYLDTKVRMNLETNDSVACSLVMEGVKPCMNVNVKNTDSSEKCKLVENNSNVGLKIAVTKAPIEMQCNIKSGNVFSVNDRENDNNDSSDNNDSNKHKKRNTCTSQYNPKLTNLKLT
jgi:hypothetical protein